MKVERLQKKESIFSKFSQFSLSTSFTDSTVRWKILLSLILSWSPAETSHQLYSCFVYPCKGKHKIMGWWKKRIYFLSCISRLISCNFLSQTVESRTVGKYTFLGCCKTLLKPKTLGMQLAQIGSERIFEKVSLARHVFGSIYT